MNHYIDQNEATLRQRQAFDTSKELLVQRYKQGIRLVRPSDSLELTSRQSVGRVFSLPTQVYFLDLEANVVDLNPTQLEMIGASSLQDAQGKGIEYFLEKNAFRRHLKTNLDVITSAQIKVKEEYGYLLDGLQFQTLSFKFPWYQNEKIIGLFGCSINIDSNHLNDFGKILSQFMSTGLLGQAPSSPMAFLPELKDGDIYFSKREREVLALLVRGKTAKEVGAILHISKRTAEIHIKNAKTKGNCASKSELIDKFLDRFI